MELMKGISPPSVISADCASIIVFACRWCALLGAERAGRERIALDAKFILIPVECASSIHSDLVLRTFADGAQGVAVMGCHLGGCRHNEANRNTHAHLSLAGAALRIFGVRPERFMLSWGTAHEGHQFASCLELFSRRIDDLRESNDLQLIRGNFWELKNRVAPCGLTSGSGKEQADETL